MPLQKEMNNEAELSARRAENTVHHLQSGVTPCGLSEIYGTPDLWPPGNLWSQVWSDVNCPACLRQQPYLKTRTV